MSPVCNFSDTGLCLSRDDRAATARVAQACLFIGPGGDDGSAGLYVIEQGGEGLDGVEFFGRAPYALAGFEIVLVVLLSLSFEALLLRRRLRREQAFWDEREHGHGHKTFHNRSSGHARIASRSRASHSVRKEALASGSMASTTAFAATWN